MYSNIFKNKLKKFLKFTDQHDFESSDIAQNNELFS